MATTTKEKSALARELCFARVLLRSALPSSPCFALPVCVSFYRRETAARGRETAAREAPDKLHLLILIFHSFMSWLLDRQRVLLLELSLLGHIRGSVRQVDSFTASGLSRGKLSEKLHVGLSLGEHLAGVFESVEHLTETRQTLYSYNWCHSRLDFFASYCMRFFIYMGGLPRQHN